MAWWKFNLAVDKVTLFFKNIIFGGAKPPNFAKILL